LHDELDNQFNCEKQAEEDDDDDVDKRKTTRRHDVTVGSLINSMSLDAISNYILILLQRI
jgi:hypothetical protein